MQVFNDTNNNNNNASASGLRTGTTDDSCTATCTTSSSRSMNTKNDSILSLQVASIKSLQINGEEEGDGNYADDDHVDDHADDHADDDDRADDHADDYYDDKDHNVKNTRGNNEEDDDGENHVAMEEEESQSVLSPAPPSLRSNRSSILIVNHNSPQRQSRRSLHNFRFAYIDVREYPRILGDNVTVMGPPVSLDWIPQFEARYELDDYEDACQYTRRSQAELKMPSKHRDAILRSSGYTRVEIQQACKKATIARNHRKRTVELIKLQPIFEVMDKVRRKGKKSLRSKKTRKSEEILKESSRHGGSIHGKGHIIIPVER